VEISNEPAVSALGVAAERDAWGQLIVAGSYIRMLWMGLKRKAAYLPGC
jgi:hypothetical protein